MWPPSFGRWEKQVSKIVKFLAQGRTASKYQNRYPNPHLPGTFSHFCQIYSEVLEKRILKFWQNKSTPFQEILIWIFPLFLCPCAFFLISCWFCAVIYANTTSVPQVSPLKVITHCPDSWEMPSSPLWHVPGLPNHAFMNVSVFSCKLFFFLIAFLCVCLQGSMLFKFFGLFLISFFHFAIKSNWAAFKWIKHFPSPIFSPYNMLCAGLCRTHSSWILEVWIAATFHGCSSFRMQFSPWSHWWHLSYKVYS